MVANDGLLSVAEALSRAETQGSPNPVEIDGLAAEENQVDVLGEHAEETVEEHPESEEVSSEAEEGSLFEDLFDEEEAQPAVEITDDFVIEGLPGFEGGVTLAELKNGYLRQADYTRKQQAAKAEREAWEARNETAVRLMEQVNSNPVGLFAALAKQIGVDVDLKGVNPSDFKIPSPADMQAEIERKARELVEQDPRIVKAKANDALALVENEFAQLEQARGVKLSQKDREVLMKASLDEGGVPLTVMYDALVARKQAKAASREAVKQTAMPNVQNVPVTAETPRTKKLSVAEALEVALASS